MDTAETNLRILLDNLDRRNTVCVLTTGNPRTRCSMRLRCRLFRGSQQAYQEAEDY